MEEYISRIEVICGIGWGIEMLVESVKGLSVWRWCVIDSIWGIF